jgi:hypothetical protein
MTHSFVNRVRVLELNLGGARLPAHTGLKITFVPQLATCLHSSQNLWLYKARYWTS